MGLTLSVLGPLEIRLDGAPVVLPVKTQALLVYLAMTGRRARREALADMFWGDTGDDGARANLRLALTKLRQALPGLVDADTESVGLAEAAVGDVDALQVLQVVDTLLQQPVDRQEAAAALQRGPFLQDFTLRECPSFDDWAAAERQRLDRRLVVLLRALVQEARRAAKPPREVRFLQQWARIEPWNEEAQLPLIRLLAQAGATAAALDSFDACRTALAEEMGVRPSVALATLADQVRRGELGAAPAPAPAPPPAPAVPAEARAPLYGREADLRAIDAQLAQGQRLICVLGPAGVGKSHLAAAVSHRAAAQYPDGRVAFGFDHMEHADGQEIQAHLVGVLGTALGLDLSLTASPMAMLKTHLATRRVLLTLDGFESCMQATPVLLELLLAAPRCLFIVTSRTRLPMAHGWVLELRGLGGDASHGRDPATVLLRDCARRNGVVLDGAGGADGQDTLLRLVRLLDGSPLAIQFAAQSLRVLSAEQLVRKLEMGAWPDSSLHVPGYRHSTLREVMDGMWSQLPQALRDAWARCSLFKGSFPLEWAAACAGVGDDVAARLVEHSILTRVAPGRLRMHELTRQYGLRMLSQSPQADSHRRTFAQAALARLVAQSSRLLREDTAAVDLLHPEIDTLAAAFDLTLPGGAPQDIQPPLQALVRVYHRLGWHHAAGRLMDTVLQRQAQAPAAWRMVWHHMAGEIAHHQYGLQGDTAHFQKVVELAGVSAPAAGAPVWGRALITLARVLMARPMAQAQDRQAQRALTHSLMALLVQRYINGEPTSALLAGLCMSALAARRSGAADAYLAVRLKLAAIDLLGRAPRLQAAAVRWARQCLAHVDPVQEAFAKRHLVLSLIAGGKWEDAQAHLSRAAQALAALGYGYDALECRTQYKTVLLHQGRFDQLLDEVRLTEAQARRINQPTILRWTLLFKLQVWLRTGCGTPGQITECLAELHAIPCRRTPIEEIRVLANEALVLAAWGDAPGVEQRAHSIVALMHRVRVGRFYAMGPMPVIIDAVFHLAGAAPTSTGALRALAVRLVSKFTDMARGMPMFEPRIHLYQGMVAALQGHEDQASQSWLRGLQCRVGDGLPYDRARLHHLLALYAAPHGPSATAHAQAAADAFAACGIAVSAACGITAVAWPLVATRKLGGGQAADVPLPDTLRSDPSHQHQDQHDHQHQPQPARGPVAPAAAVAPAGQRADQEQDQNDQQDE